jgi:hypothetical protein
MDPDTRGIIIVAVLVGLMFRAGSFTTVRAAGKRAPEIWDFKTMKRKLRSQALFCDIEPQAQWQKLANSCRRKTRQIQPQ